MLTVALMGSAGVPSVAWAEDDSVADILENAETVAVGEPTPSDAVLPKVQISEDAPASVELSTSDLEVALGKSTDARASVSGQYAIVQSASVTYAVSHPGDGATRLSAILANPVDDYPEWTFERGTQLLLLDDGSVSVSDGRKFLGAIDFPWAVDAAGRALPTRYEVSGSTLTQIVDTREAEFPVVADPTVQFYGPYIQVHLNKTESIAAVGTYATCAAVLNKSPVWFAKALQIACGTVAAFSTAQLAGGQCVSIHYVVAVGGPAGVWLPWFRKC